VCRFDTHVQYKAPDKLLPFIPMNSLQVFMLKYVCPQGGCGGTLAPLLSTDRVQCNMCGFSRTEAEFLEELKEYY